MIATVALTRFWCDSCTTLMRFSYRSAESRFGRELYLDQMNSNKTQSGKMSFRSNDIRPNTPNIGTFRTVVTLRSRKSMSGAILKFEIAASGLWSTDSLKICEFLNWGNTNQSKSQDANSGYCKLVKNAQTSPNMASLKISFCLSRSRSGYLALVLSHPAITGSHV